MVTKRIFLAVLLTVTFGSGALYQRTMDARYVARAFHFHSRNLKADVDRAAQIEREALDMLKRR